MNESDPIPLPNEKEVLPWFQILLITAIALSSFALAIAWTIWMMRSDGLGVEQARRVAPAPDVGRPQIGIVNQTLFELGTTPEENRLREDQHLHSYGWVDREAGVVRLPIDRAIEILSEEAPQ